MKLDKKKIPPIKNIIAISMMIIGGIILVISGYWTIGQNLSSHHSHFFDEALFWAYMIYYIMWMIIGVALIIWGKLLYKKKALNMDVN